MSVRIDFRSSVPVFEQIMHQVKASIASGAWRSGEAIPSVRRMAEEILVNPNTVARAYRELEREGVISARRGSGLFVAEGAEAACREDRMEALRRKFSEIVAEAEAAGIPKQRLRRELEEALQDSIWETRKGV